MPTEQRFPELPGWVFTVEERSAGIYAVVGMNDATKASVHCEGADLDELMSGCKADAASTFLPPT